MPNHSVGKIAKWVPLGMWGGNEAFPAVSLT